MSRELPSSLAATPHLLHSSPSFFLSTLPFPRETRKFFSIYSSNFYEGCKGYKEMFPLKKKRKNTIEKKLKLKIRIKIRANLLSVNWTIQFPGSGENNCSRPSSKIESLSLYISLRWLARGFIGFRGRAAPSFFQVAARSREVASSSIIRLRPSHLTNVSVRFHIAAFSSFSLSVDPRFLEDFSFSFPLSLSLVSGKDDVQAIFGSPVS